MGNFSLGQIFTIYLNYTCINHDPENWPPPQGKVTLYPKVTITTLTVDG